MAIKLRPMSEVPKDREVFAVFLRHDCYGSPVAGSIDLGNFHPLQWIDRPWQKDWIARWGMRWNENYYANIKDFGGWFDPKDPENFLYK